MEILKSSLPYDHDLVLFSDFHYGTKLLEETAVDRVRETLETKNTFGIFGGDVCEAITVIDKRWNPESDRRLLPLQQYKDTKEEFFRPLRKKIIAAMIGNHDWRLAAIFGNYLKDEICADLNIPYGGYTQKMAITDPKGKMLYKIFYTHGFGRVYSYADDPIRREANMKLQLKRKLQDKAGDCEIMAIGHSHKLIVVEPTARLYLYDDGHKIKAAYTTGMSGEKFIPADHRWYVNTGSFMRLYREGVIGYGELMGYDPVDLGFAVIECRSGKIVGIRKKAI